MTHVKFNNRPLSKGFGLVFDEIFNNIPTWNEYGINFPPVNIHETSEAFHLEVSAPGFNKEDFQVNLDKGVLTIGVEKQEEAKTEGYKTVRREFSHRSFKRTFNLDEQVDVEKIAAKYENGILKLYLPKQENKQQAKNINIQ